MGWTYISSMDEYDKEVQKDQSSIDRYTFKRYMYFMPDQYNQWSKGQDYNNIPYSAELIGDANIPSAGTYLSGTLSNFYVKDVLSIKNLSEEKHGDQCSFAVVTIEYENKPSDTAGGTNKSSLKPWEKPVEDFTVINQEISLPFTAGEEVTPGVQSGVRAVATTAGQPLYGFTTSYWIQRISWTYCTLSGDYSLSAAVLNKDDTNLFGIQIPAIKGLLLPPARRDKYYYKNERDTDPQLYQEWYFEIIVNIPKGFDVEVLNCGTKALWGGYLTDICSWYTYDPTSQTAPWKFHGNFTEMMNEKRRVDTINKTITNPDNKLVWTGDFVSAQVPLTRIGAVDGGALMDPTLTYKRIYRKYDAGTWNIGFR